MESLKLSCFSCFWYLWFCCNYMYWMWLSNLSFLLMYVHLYIHFLGCHIKSVPSFLFLLVMVLWEQSCCNSKCFELFLLMLLSTYIIVDTFYVICFLLLLIKCSFHSFSFDYTFVWRNYLLASHNRSYLGGDALALFICPIFWFLTNIFRNPLAIFLLLLSVMVLLECTLVCCHLVETNFETTPLRLVLNYSFCSYAPHYSHVASWFVGLFASWTPLPCTKAYM